MWSQTSHPSSSDDGDETWRHYYIRYSNFVDAQPTQLVGIWRPLSPKIWLYQRQEDRGGELSYPMKEGQRYHILTSTLAVFLFSRLQPPKRDREAHLNYISRLSSDQLYQQSLATPDALRYVPRGAYGIVSQRIRCERTFRRYVKWLRRFRD